MRPHNQALRPTHAFFKGSVKNNFPKLPELKKSVVIPAREKFIENDPHFFPVS
jgi:hypothetical protein